MYAMSMPKLTPNTDQHPRPSDGSHRLNNCTRSMLQALKASTRTNRMEAPAAPEISTTNAMRNSFKVDESALSSTKGLNTLGEPTLVRTRLYSNIETSENIALLDLLSNLIATYDSTSKRLRSAMKIESQRCDGSVAMLKIVTIKTCELSTKGELPMP